MGQFLENYKNGEKKIRREYRIMVEWMDGWMEQKFQTDQKFE